MKDFIEIENIEKYNQKKVRIEYNSLCVYVCVCVCVYVCVCVCVGYISVFIVCGTYNLYLTCLRMKIHALCEKFDVVSWMYKAQQSPGRGRKILKKSKNSEKKR